MSTFSVGKTGPSQHSQLPKLEDELAQAMRLPEDQRLEKVKDMFEGLSPAEAKQLYNTLKENKDEISKEFGRRFRTDKNELMQTLKSNFAPGSEKEAVQDTRSQPKADVSSRRGDLNFDGKAQQARLQQEYDKNSKMDPKGRKILEDTIVKAEGKDLYRIIDDLSQRDPSSKQLLASILGDSNKLLQRISTDIAPRDQVKLLNFMQENYRGKNDYLQPLLQNPATAKLFVEEGKGGPQIMRTEGGANFLKGLPAETRIKAMEQYVNSLKISQKGPQDKKNFAELLNSFTGAERNSTEVKLLEFTYLLDEKRGNQ
jgi:hypothetical protein